MLNSDRIVKFEFIMLPFVLYYSRFFTVGLSTVWGMVVASFVSRSVDICMVVAWHLISTHLQTMFLWTNPSIIPSVNVPLPQNFKDFWWMPFKNREFHFLHMNLLWLSGLTATIMCCVQSFVFAYVFVEERWKIQYYWKTGTALMLLISSDLYYVIILTYVGRRWNSKKGKPQKYGEGLTQAITPLVLAGLFVATGVVIVWTTWRSFTFQACMRKVSSFIFLIPHISGFT